MKDISYSTSILRFILSFVIVLFTLVWFAGLYFKVIPPENKDVINFASGIILGQGWVTIIKWWFPSDIGSEHKTDLLYASTPNPKPTSSTTESTINTKTESKTIIPDPELVKAKADYLAKFAVICPEGKTIEEIQAAITANTAFV